MTKIFGKVESHPTSSLFPLPSSLFPLPSSLSSGFTLIELLVVVAMVAVIMGAMTTSVNAARARARLQKAQSDVKVISQAILAYENWNGGELPTLTRAEASKDNIGFLLGQGNAEGSGTPGANGSGKLPVLLEAALSGKGTILDPWGHPYLVTIRKGSATMKTKTATGTLNTGFYLPNFYRISEGER